MNSYWKRWLLSGIVAVLFPAMAWAAPVQVASTFRVVVRDTNDQPKPDVRVTLGKQTAYNLRGILRGSTSADGILSFGKVAPGQYTLQFVDPVGETNLVEIEVLAKGGQPELSYAWPYVHWIPMRFVSGILMNGATPLNHRSMVLRSFPGEAVLSSAETDLMGGFDLPVTTPGRYIIDISRRLPSGVEESVGRIYAVVSLQGERRGTEPLFLEQLPSGRLEYDRVCKLPAAEVKDSCFQALTVEGSPVASAVFKIRPDSGFAPAQTYSSDAQGFIKLPLLPAGGYQVQMYGKGLVPVELGVKLSGNAGACTSPLKISFNVIGSGCAPATPGKAN